MGKETQLAAGKYVLLGNEKRLAEAGWSQEMDMEQTLRLAEEMVPEPEGSMQEEMVPKALLPQP